MLFALAALAVLLSACGRLGPDTARGGDGPAVLVSPSRSSPAGVGPGAGSVPLSGAEAGGEREQALEALLAERAAAVRAGDRARFLALLDDPRSPFGLRQRDLFDRLIRLPLGAFDYSAVEPAPALGPERAREVGPAAWAARVSGSYTLEGFDRVARPFESHLTVVRRSTGWRLADDADGGTPPQLWDLKDLRVVPGRRVLVVGNAPPAVLAAYARHGDEAVARTSAVWSRPWGGRLVVVAPATVAEMAQQVGERPESVGQVAAVTDGPLDTRGRGGADRIVVNPDAFLRLEETGRRVVLAHEALHVAVRATTAGQVPLWLSEGLADYVGYGGLGLGREEVAAPLLALLRQRRGPSALPSDDDFDPAHTTIAPSYNAAWLAVSLMADRYGPARLVEFYEEAAAGGASGEATPEESTRQAFAAVLGVTQEEFTAEWLRHLAALASGRAGGG